MQTEDQSTGDGQETPSTLEPSQNQETPEIQHDSTPINPVSEALDAFERERSGVTPFQSAQPKPSLPAQRDYSGLEPDEIPIFRDMRNTSYAKLYPMYLEHKKLKTEHETLQKQLNEVKGVSLYESEGAWRLAPEYAELTQDTQRLDAEVAHWQSQLENAEAGNEVQLLEQDAQGNIYIGKAIPCNPGLKAKIIAAMNTAITLKANAQSKLSTYEQSFKSKHQEFTGKLKSVEQQIFAGVPAEKLEKAAQPKLQLFPAYLRNQPVTQMLAKSLAVIDGLTRMVEHLRGASTTAAAKAKTAASAGPTSETVSPGTGKAGTKVSDVMQEFRDARMRGIA